VRLDEAEGHGRTISRPSDGMHVASRARDPYSPARARDGSPVA
jgi:hypothetical protein